MSESLKYWEQVYGIGNVRLDPTTGEVVINRITKDVSQRSAAQVKGSTDEPKEKIVDPRSRNKARYPGRGATDEQWRTYAARQFALPGATLIVPQAPTEKRKRGFWILNLLRGKSVEYRWVCGCSQKGDDYHPCGTSSCVVNPK